MDSQRVTIFSLDENSMLSMKREFGQAVPSIKKISEGK